MQKKLFQLYIDIDQYEYVKEKANKTGRSRAGVVRDIIEAHRRAEGSAAKIYKRKGKEVR